MKRKACALMKKRVQFLISYKRVSYKKKRVNIQKSNVFEIRTRMSL